MLSRRFRQAGMHPALGYVLSPVIFVGLVEICFYKTSFAVYLVLLSAASVISRLAERNRTEFLQVVFGDKKYRRVRLLENLIVALPFLAMLLYHREFVGGAVLSLPVIGFAYTSVGAGFQFSVKTPFYRWPFEFTVGFRNTLLFLPMIYAVVVLGILVNNPNLGIFGNLSVFFLAFTYYVKPEPEYFVWIFAKHPRHFLWSKMKIALLYSSMLALPAALCLISFYPEKTPIILLFNGLGLVGLLVGVLAKYSAYPNEMHLPETIMMGLGLYFPPLLLAVIPYFYFRSIKNLNSLLP